jgi:hypothetical protein
LVLLVVATGAAAVRVAGGSDLPAPTAKAFPVTVDLDGVVRTVHTTERTAQGLMRSLHVGKLVGVRNIPGRLRAGSDVVLRTRHNGILLVDGQAVPFDSASATVDELLVSNNVALLGDDYTEPAHDDKLVDGDTVKVLRVGGETRQTTEVIPFTEEHQADPNIPIASAPALTACSPPPRERIENGVVVDHRCRAVRTHEPDRRSVATAKADWHWDAPQRASRAASGARSTTAVVGDGGPASLRHRNALGGKDSLPAATREEQIVVGQRIFDEYGWDPGAAPDVLHWV